MLKDETRFIICQTSPDVEKEHSNNYKFSG